MLVLLQDPDYEPETGVILSQLVAEIRRSIEDSINEPREHVTIDLWLESPGGDAHAAYKLAVLLRSYCSRLRVIVPDYAKSAATLLALGADELFMGPAAELGPLDAQIPKEGGIPPVISALDVARSLDDLLQDSMYFAIHGATGILQTTRLSRADSLQAMLDFSAKLMEPIIRQLDPTMIHYSNTLLNVSVAYADRLLDMRQEGGGETAALPKYLVEKYPTHGFVISRNEARGLGLPVTDLAEYDLVKEVTVRHRVFEQTRANAIQLMTPSDLERSPDHA